MFSIRVNAQELQANVEVMHSRIQGVDAKVFNSLKESLQNFLNSRKWSNDNFLPIEKIQCNFFLNVTEMVGTIEENMYKATLTVTASRPVFNSTYTTSIFNFMDRDISFRFEPSQIIQFDDNRIAGNEAMIANLPAIFAFYAYMILGFDYDSFSKMGGDPYFKKAQNIAMNAPEDTRMITGWKSSERRTNRYWLVDQVMNPRFADLREYWYNYHIGGLDQLRSDPTKAYENMTGNLEKLKTINLENPTSIFLMSFFTAKSPELLNILSQLPMDKKNAAKNLLSEIDVPNAAKYKAVK